MLDKIMEYKTDIAIYLVSFQRPNLIKNCLASIFNQTILKTNVKVKLYILDNSQGIAREPTRNYLSSIKNPIVKLFFEDTYMYYGDAISKLMLELSDRDEKYSMIYADDYVMHPQKLEYLYKYMEKYPDVSCVSGKMKVEGGPIYGDCESVVNASFKISIYQILQKREIIDKVGKWKVVRNDEGPWFPDGWFSNEVYLLGYRPVYAFRTLQKEFNLSDNCFFDTTLDRVHNQGVKGRWRRIIEAIKSGKTDEQLYE